MNKWTKKLNKRFEKNYGMRWWKGSTEIFILWLGQYLIIDTFFLCFHRLRWIALYHHRRKVNNGPKKKYRKKSHIYYIVSSSLIWATAIFWEQRTGCLWHFFVFLKAVFVTDKMNEIRRHSIVTKVFMTFCEELFGF